MSEKPPLVSVGLPVFNGEKYLAVCLESILAQDYDDFELIVSDNCSTDRTEEICRTYASGDRRILYHRNESNIGSAPNYRRVFELARGRFFKWISHDDFCYPSFLRRCLEVFLASSDAVVLVYGLCELVSADGAVIGHATDRVEVRDSRPYRRLAHVLKNVSYAYPTFGLIKSNCLRKTMLSGDVPYWDQSLLAELSLLGEFREVPEVLSQQRCHEGNALARASREAGHINSRHPNNLDRATRRALRRWTNPARGTSGVWLPAHEEHYWEYMKRIHHAPLARREKALCYTTVAALCYWLQLRRVGGKWKRQLRERLAAAGRAN